MSRSRDHQVPSEDSDNEFDAIVASTGLRHCGPRVLVLWEASRVEFEVWFGDNTPATAWWKLLHEARVQLTAGLDPDCLELTKTSHAWAVHARLGGVEAIVPFAPKSNWQPLVQEQVFAMVVAAFATDPWKDILQVACPHDLSY